MEVHAGLFTSSERRSSLHIILLLLLGDFGLIGNFIPSSFLFLFFHTHFSSLSLSSLSHTQKDGFYPYYCDVIMISSATLVLSCVSTYAFILLLSIPIFSLYKAFSLVGTIQSALPPAPAPAAPQTNDKNSRGRGRR